MTNYKLSIWFLLLLTVYKLELKCEAQKIPFETVRNDTDKLNSVRYSVPRQRWNGTKPPFPRYTPPCTKDSIKLNIRLVHSRTGEKVYLQRNPLPLTKQRFSYREPSEIPTLFELLNEIIYKSLMYPQLGFSEKLLQELDQFYYYLQLVKSMFIDKKERAVEALKYSVFRLFVSKGGPEFTKVPLNEPEFKKKLVYAFGWNDKDLENMRKRLKVIENTWYRVQMNIFDMDQLRKLRGNLTFQMMEDAYQSVTTVNPRLVNLSLIHIYERSRDKRIRNLYQI